MELKGKTILITGGASGIGLEAAKQLLEIGAKVIITGRNQDKLDVAKSKYLKLTAIKSDLANAEDAAILLRKLKSWEGLILFTIMRVYWSRRPIWVSQVINMQREQHTKWKSIIWLS